MKGQTTGLHSSCGDGPERLPFSESTLYGFIVSESFDFVNSIGRFIFLHLFGKRAPAGCDPAADKKRTCRRMEKFCGRFSLAGKEEIRSKTHNMRLYSAKMCTTNLTQTVCLRLCGELFCFSGLTRSFSWTHGSGACPAPASSTAFSGQRPGPAGTAPCGCWPCPRLKNGGIQSHSSADQRRLPPE